jgi:hypothetical protein
VSKISGKGAVELALVDGSLYPTLKQSVDTAFSASQTDPQSNKTITLDITLQQGAQVTPK